MKNNRVLLVGSSFSAVPLMEYLKTDGYHVSVCGGLKDDPCHSYADQSYYIDYSDKDALLELCRQVEFDFLVPTCNDYSYNSASYVATKLKKFYGFDDVSTTATLHTKNGFRSFTIDNAFPVPFAFKADTELDPGALGDCVLLVKPDDSFSGKGVTKVFDRSQLPEAIATAKKNSRNGEAIVEEFVNGNLYSHSAFIQDGKILVDFFVDEFCSVYPYQVDSSSLTTTLSEKMQTEVRESISRLVSLLSLSNGLIHTQFIADDAKFWLIETMRRCPGDLYGSLIQKSTGFPYARYYVTPFLNRQNVPQIIESGKFIARHTITVPEKLSFQSFQVKVPSIATEIFPLKESGHALKEAPYDKVGIVFSEFESVEALRHFTPQMKDFVEVTSIGGGV